MTYPKKLLHAILRQDFNSFINKVFNTINPGIEYQANWHIELIAEYLQAVQNGDIKRLIINMPPRSLKSVCIGVAWPAWILGHDPAKRIMSASYSQVLSVKHSLDCRLILTSDWYQQIFPKTILSKKHNQKSKFLTNNNGFRFATSVGGSATGEGGDILIIDDPHNPTQINSPKMRKRVIEWFEQTFVTRLNNKNTGAIVLVMQRLHEEDLSGHLLANSNYWHHLKIPAMAKREQIFSINNYKYQYVIGDILHSFRDNPDYLIKLEQEIGVHNYAAQYLQEPISNNCILLNIEDISFYETIPKKFDYFVQSWDTAIKISENADYSVCSSWGILDKKYYLVGLFRQKVTYPELKGQVEKLAKKYCPRYILIEDKASGQQVIQDLRLDGVVNIVAIKPKLDKITRFSSVLALFQSAAVVLPKQSAFNTILLNELLSFPHCKNDDIVDSVSQFLNFIKERSNKSLARIRGF
ncbi:phage terminase large subunit [Candidatus Tisiphia endosymbiont of Hybos culiciformis]|uniref:phage terminase large subunit n=1 Tax=Candidatus Tisiphia endosymbiont of Hybos culiciformis TaxID=3139331 RepID=UPI003CCA7555